MRHEDLLRRNRNAAASARSGNLLLPQRARSRPAAARRRSAGGRLRRRSFAISLTIAGSRDVDAWAGRDGWKKSHVQNPAPRHQTEATPLEPWQARRPETASAAETGPGDPCAPRTRWQPLRSRSVQSHHRQQVAGLRPRRSEGRRARCRRSCPRTRTGHPEQDAPPCSVRSHEKHPSFDLGLGESAGDDRLRLPVPEPVSCQSGR